MRNILASAAAAWSGRILAIVLNLWGTALAYSLLGEEKFGVLLIALSVGPWVGLLTPTFGRVVATVVARSHKRSPMFAHQAVQASLRASMLFNTGFACVWAACLFVYLFYLAHTASILSNRLEIFASILIIFIGMSVWSHVSIYEGVEAAHEALFRVSMLQSASYLASFVMLLVLFRSQPSIPLAAYLLSLSFLLGSVIHAFGASKRYPAIFRPTSIRPGLTAKLIRASLNFTIIYFSLGLLYQVSVGIIGFYVEAREIIELGLIMRLAQAFLSIVFGLLYPMASTITARIAANDTPAAVHGAQVTLTMLLGGAFLAASTIGFFSPALMSLWIGRVTDLSFGFKLAAAALFWILPLQSYVLWLLVGLEQSGAAARAHVAQALAFALSAPVFYVLWKQAGVLLSVDCALTFGTVLMCFALRSDVRSAAFVALLMPRWRKLLRRRWTFYSILDARNPQRAAEKVRVHRP